MRKAVSILVTLAMLIGLLLPAGSAFAATTNVALTVPSVTTGLGKTVGTLQVKESTVGSVGVGDVVTFTLLDGVSLSSGVTFAVYDSGDGGINPYAGVSAAVYAPASVGSDTNRITDITLVGSTSNSVTVKVNGINPANDAAILQVIMNQAVDVSNSGDIRVNIFSPNTGFTQGDVVVAKCASGSSDIMAIDTSTVSSGNARDVGIVRITETTTAAFVYNGSNPTGSNTIKLTLPVGITWNSVQNLVTSGWGTAPVITNFEGRDAYITIAAVSTNPGLIQFTPRVNIDSSEAKKGDITLNISGSNSGVANKTITIGTYGDFGTDVTAENATTVYTGKTDQEIGDIVFKETLAGSLVNARVVRLELEGNAKWHTLPTQTSISGTAGVLTAPYVSNDGKAVEYTVDDSTSAAKFKLENATIDLAADFEGDVKVIVSGTAGAAAELVVAKTAKPATIKAAAKTKAIIGSQAQLVADLEIVEAQGESMKRSGTVRVTNGATNGTITTTNVPRDANLTVTAPIGVTFTSTPKVEVVEGDIQIDAVNVRTTTTNTGEGQVVIPIKAVSSVASKIKVSGIKVTVDRTVPEGDLKFKLGGLPVNETSTVFTAATTVDKAYPAEVVTPAAKEEGSVSFNIGSSVYTVNGVTKVMDAAPYIKEGRTYVPVRYLALSLGVAEQNISYENGVVTLVKGDTTLKLTIGAKNMDVNSEVKTMDVAPEVVNGRTMLPARFVAEGFGALVGFANGQVVISY